jgi:hypothetical protein
MTLAPPSPLDPAAATIPVHGQIATASGRSRMTVSATKLLREGFRARLLLVPGLARAIVELDEDTVRLSVRSVDGASLRWRSTGHTGTLVSGAESFGPDRPSVMRSTLLAERGATAMEIALLLVVTPQPSERRARVLGRADLRLIAGLPGAQGRRAPAR